MASGGFTCSVNEAGMAIYSKHGLIGIMFRIKNTTQLWWKEGIEVDLDQWFHIAATWSKDKNLNIFLNGTMLHTIGSSTYSPAVSTSVGSDMHVGKPNNVYDLYAQFTLDEWYVWDNELNNEHIEQIYRSYFKGKYTKT